MKEHELSWRWRARRGLTMRIEHTAGDKAFVDYSGNKLHLVDPQTGECIPVELFVGVLGASNYTYAEASMTQRGHDFIDSNVRELDDARAGAAAALRPSLDPPEPLAGPLGLPQLARAEPMWRALAAVLWDTR